MNNLPNDPIILLSVVNTKLRDLYPTLDALCEELGINCDEITKNLSDVGFMYDEKTNQFK